MMRKTLLAALIVIAGCRRHETPSPAPQQQKPAGFGMKRGPDAPPSPVTPATSTETSVGSPMPAYNAELLDGSSFNVGNERGNVVLLNLWATWCGPCRFEIPELEKLHKEYAAQGFKVVGVSLDESGKEAVQQFVDENAMTYPIALDPEGRLANVFQTTVIPTTVLIDRSGNIVWKKLGPVQLNDELKQALDKALAEKRG